MINYVVLFFSGQDFVKQIMVAILKILPCIGIFGIILVPIGIYFLCKVETTSVRLFLLLLSGSKYTRNLILNLKQQLEKNRPGKMASLRIKIGINGSSNTVRTVLNAIVNGRV